MIRKYSDKSMKFGIPGLVLHALAAWLHVPVLSWLIAVVGSLLLCLGLCYFARAKGRSILWGLLGFFSFFGLIVLAVIPDRAKDGALPR